uniref:Uncharacterized protein n=1 Tax=Romanomermis culicivorax TaxID=13658 RepID=A0A915JZM2_ROMCU
MSDNDSLIDRFQQLSAPPYLKEKSIEITSENVRNVTEDWPLEALTYAFRQHQAEKQIYTQCEKAKGDLHNMNAAQQEH